MNPLQNTNDHTSLKVYIECLRKELIRVGIQEGLSNEKTIKLSQKLDLFIAKYQSMNNF